MSVALVGRAPFKSVLGYEKMLDENGREMHGSWGNMIDAEDAFERMGADVMRWQFAAQPPDRNLLFGYGPAHEAKRRLLTFWHSAKFLVDYGNVDAFVPRFADLESRP
jgi:isoleucyl-tRNA synthetase